MSGKHMMGRPIDESTAEAPAAPTSEASEDDIETSAAPESAMYDSGLHD